MLVRIGADHAIAAPAPTRLSIFLREIPSLTSNSSGLIHSPPSQEVLTLSPRLRGKESPTVLLGRLVSRRELFSPWAGWRPYRPYGRCPVRPYVADATKGRIRTGRFLLAEPLETLGRVIAAFLHYGDSAAEAVGTLPRTPQKSYRGGTMRPFGLERTLRTSFAGVSKGVSMNPE